MADNTLNVNTSSVSFLVFLFVCLLFSSSYLVAKRGLIQVYFLSEKSHFLPLVASDADFAFFW